MLKRIAGVLIALLIWQALTMAVQSPILKGVPEIAAAALKVCQTPDFWRNVASSMGIAVKGYLMALLFGWALSVIIYNVPFVRHVFEPVINGVRNAPVASLIPVFIVLLGVEMAKVTAVFWVAWPSIAVSALFGYSQVEKEVIEAAGIDGATPFQQFWFIRLPLSRDAIFTGAKIGAGAGWVALITAETIGSTKGMGYAIITKTQVFRYAEAYVYIVAIALISYASVSLIERLQSKKEVRNDKVFKKDL